MCAGLLFGFAPYMMKSGADIAYLLALQGLRQRAGEWLTAVMKAFTSLGGAEIAVVLGAVLYWCVDKRAGERILFFNVAGTGVNQLIKCTACVYRPWVRDARVTPVAEALKTATGYSYPSGHTANAGSWTMGLLSWVRENGGRGARAAWAAGLALVWLLVGFSRNFLGVHTPQDVCVMIALMLPIMMGCEGALRYADGGRRQENIVAVCGVLFGVGLAIWAAVKGYPLDYDEAGKLLVDPAVLTTDTFKTAGMVTGFFAGWLCERRYVRFRVGGGIWRRVLRGALGIALMLAAEKGLSFALVHLIGSLWGQFAAKFMLFMFITALYPLLLRVYSSRTRGRSARQAA